LVPNHKPVHRKSEGVWAPACPGNGWKRYFTTSEKKSERGAVLKLLSGKTRKARPKKRSKGKAATTKKKKTKKKKRK
jgi:hypothetical protein